MSRKRKVKVTLELTPEQVRQAYWQMLRQTHPDWFEEPEVIEELLRRRKQGLKELREGKAVAWEELERRMKVK